MQDVSVDGVYASPQVVHHPVRKVDNIVDADHVIAGALVEASRLATSSVASLFYPPLQPTGVLLRQEEQFLHPPEGRHLFVVAGHRAPLELKNIVIGVLTVVKGAEKTKNKGFNSLSIVK